MKKPKYVFSGLVKIGNVGEMTPLRDSTHLNLFVGDIVIISTIDSHGICNNCGLSVVVSDEDQVYFIMGIKKVDFMGKDSENWIVKRVKSFKDVISGEHWKDYGFNYQ